MSRRLPDRAEDLYRLPLGEFIAARDALVRSLREEGQPGEAKEVKALRKPSVPAWAINQLCEEDPDGVGELIDAGTELREAQRAVMSSRRDAGRLAAASEQRRGAVTRLMRVASQALSRTGGASSAHLDEVRAGLEAASVDHDAAQQLWEGSFERPPVPSLGLGEIPGGLTSLPTGDEVVEHEAKSKQAKAAGAAPRLPERGAILKAEVTRLRRDREVANRKLKKEQGAADLITRERTDLEARLRKAQVRQSAAEERLAAAKAGSRDAERALKRAEDRLKRAHTT